MPRNLENRGDVGSALCGTYTRSHPEATLEGYGGATVRGYSFAGSTHVNVVDGAAVNLISWAGTVIGFDVLTDSRDIRIVQSTVEGLEAGLAFSANRGPNEAPDAIGIHMAGGTSQVILDRITVLGLTAFDDEVAMRQDASVLTLGNAGLE